MKAARKRDTRAQPEVPVLDRWLEAEVIAMPERRPSAPRVLVRRRSSPLVSPYGADICSYPGEPVISLFTGAGGMDIGFEQAGMVSVVQHEWDHTACQTLIANRPTFFRHAALIQGDIRQTPTSMLLDEAGLRVGEVTMVVGGPPCQGFSSANAKAVVGTYDVRNDLVFQFLRVVNEARPKFFIFENVPGFVRFNKGEYFKAFLVQAHACYYELVYGLIDAVEYGVPQYRCRFICAGTRRDLAEVEGCLASLPKPQCFGDEDLDRIREMERLILFDGEELDLHTHAPGVRYFPDRPVLIPPAPVAHLPGQRGVRAKGFVEFFRKLEREEPDRVVWTPRHASDYDASARFYTGVIE